MFSKTVVLGIIFIIMAILLILHVVSRSKESPEVKQKRDVLVAKTKQALKENPHEDTE